MTLTTLKVVNGDQTRFESVKSGKSNTEFLTLELMDPKKHQRTKSNIQSTVKIKEIAITKSAKANSLSVDLRITLKEAKNNAERAAIIDNLVNQFPCHKGGMSKISEAHKLSDESITFDMSNLPKVLVVERLKRIAKELNGLTPDTIEELSNLIVSGAKEPLGNEKLFFNTLLLELTERQCIGEQYPSDKTVSLEAEALTIDNLKSDPDQTAVYTLGIIFANKEESSKFAFAAFQLLQKIKKGSRFYIDAVFTAAQCLEKVLNSTYKDRLPKALAYYMFLTKTLDHKISKERAQAILSEHYPKVDYIVLEQSIELKKEGDKFSIVEQAIQDAINPKEGNTANASDSKSIVEKLNAAGVGKLALNNGQNKGDAGKTAAISSAATASSTGASSSVVTVSSTGASPSTATVSSAATPSRIDATSNLGIAPPTLSASVATTKHTPLTPELLGIVPVNLGHVPTVSLSEMSIVPDASLSDSSSVVAATTTTLASFVSSVAPVSDAIVSVTSVDSILSAAVASALSHPAADSPSTAAIVSATATEVRSPVSSVKSAAVKTVVPTSPVKPSTVTAMASASLVKPAVITTVPTSPVKPAVTSSAPKSPVKPAATTIVPTSPIKSVTAATVAPPKLSQPSQPSQSTSSTRPVPPPPPRKAKTSVSAGNSPLHVPSGSSSASLPVSPTMIFSPLPPIAGSPSTANPTATAAVPSAAPITSIKTSTVMPSTAAKSTVIAPPTVPSTKDKSKDGAEMDITATRSRAVSENTVLKHRTKDGSTMQSPPPAPKQKDQIFSVDPNVLRSVLTSDQVTLKKITPPVSNTAASAAANTVNSVEASTTTSITTSSTSNQRRSIS